ncbi:hypothetical protein E2C01_008246 [Portunus trituberculatus]|uniref:Uncharacterized protein n=1 Tax=Portunus trituberculatus TaxID=210409 RepID=A0A5B7D3F4_PORTR|nr:hypothetical protein [Portunus trituberculatus]
MSHQAEAVEAGARGPPQRPDTRSQAAIYTSRITKVTYNPNTERASVRVQGRGGRCRMGVVAGGQGGGTDRRSIPPQPAAFLKLGETRLKPHSPRELQAMIELQSAGDFLAGRRPTCLSLPRHPLPAGCVPPGEDEGGERLGRHLLPGTGWRSKMTGYLYGRAKRSSSPDTHERSPAATPQGPDHARPGSPYWIG